MERLAELKIEILSFLRDFMGAKLPDLASVEPEKSLYHKAAWDEIQFQVLPHTEYLNNHITVVVNSYAFRVEKEAINYVVNVLDGYKHEDLENLVKVIENPRDQSVQLGAYVPQVDIEGEGEFYDDGALGVNYTKVDDRFEGLTKFVYTEFEHIATLLRDASLLYREDTSKIKTHDIVLRLNTRKPGKETAFFFTVTHVPHTFDPNEPICPVKTPMTEDDKLDLFNYNVISADGDFTYGAKIEAALDRVNKQIQTFIQCEEAMLYKSCEEQVVSYVNGVLIPMVVTVQLQPYSTFGGSWQQLAKEEGNTPNSEACLAVIDTVLENVWGMLDGLEAANDNFDISYFALDTDSFGVYGMNEKGKPIHTVVSGPYTFRHAIERHHTEGFIDIFKGYLKTVKNKRIFTHQGKIDMDSISLKPKKKKADGVFNKS